MPDPENPTEPTIDVCFMNFTREEILRILGNEALAKQLVEYDKSRAIARIDELMSLYEAPVTALFLNAKAVMGARAEWTMTIPVSLSDSISKFLEQPLE